MQLKLPTFDLKFRMYSLEGIDGCGKSTQAKAVTRNLKQRGIDSVLLTNPSDSILGRFLRENLTTLAPWQRVSLFILDMADVLNSVDKNLVIIWDRYLDSTLVSNKEFNPEEISPLLSGFPLPRKTFFLDVKPNEIQKNRELHDHSKDINWQKLKYKRYKQLISKNCDGFILIDGTEDKEIVTKRIIENIVADLRQA